MESSISIEQFNNFNGFGDRGGWGHRGGRGFGRHGFCHHGHRGGFGVVGGRPGGFRGGFAHRGGFSCRGWGRGGLREMGPMSENSYRGRGEHGKGRSRTCTLLSSENVSPDSKLLRFALESPDEVLSEQVEAVVKLRATLPSGEISERLYSPVSSTKQRGSFDLLVKLFGPGRMSAFLHSMTPGDKIEVLGPRVKFPVVANQYRHVGMVAGGVGITSVFQVAQELLTSEDDHTEITLLHVARHEADLVLRGKLQELQQKNPERFHLHYMLSQPGESWQGLRGHVTDAVLKDIMPAPADGTMMMICGPESFCEALCGKSHHGHELMEVRGMLKKLGYTPAMVHCF